MQTWRTSRRGLEFIGAWEGYRARPYNDAAGHATIGYGHLMHYGPVTGWDRLRYPRGLSVPAALKLLHQDVAKAEWAVNAYLGVGVVMAQFDALVSFAYNCGGGALLHSSLLRDINRGAPPAVIRADFLMWNHAGGIVLDGLTRRRQQEADMFLRGFYATP